MLLHGDSHTPVVHSVTDAEDTPRGGGGGAGEGVAGGRMAEQDAAVREEFRSERNTMRATYRQRRKEGACVQGRVRSCADGVCTCARASPRLRPGQRMPQLSAVMIAD